MATTSLYLLQSPGHPAIEISQDELRSLLDEIETELHHSKVYRRALAMMQQLLGSSAEQAQSLFQSIGREAIGLAFRQFVQHSQKTEDENKQSENNHQTDNNNIEIVATLSEEAEVVDYTPCLTDVRVHQKESVETTVREVPLKPEVVQTVESQPIKKKQSKWFGNRKPTKAELAEQKAQQRIESLRQVGQKLRQVRELQGLSLNQLHVYTHVPIHQMAAIEEGNWDALAEDVYVRGFIRVMGNALGLDGTNLAASLPVSEPTKLVLPTSYQSQFQSSNLGFGIKPVHLYVGYAALVAGSLGGLSIMSQQANANAGIETGEAPTSSDVKQSLKDEKPTAKPGLQSSTAGIAVGSDIAPPEAL
ncbi:helix-turn-helix domain-containing protein [Scytonema sp. NUACC26]|uniref:helix-turn-helix domain-containing protein n=1 Tax=Scytonema sp. NUACC26 TaxID=3140176 RepID=UPI0034DCA111